MSLRTRSFLLFATLVFFLVTTGLLSGTAGTFAIGSWSEIEPSLQTRRGAAAAQLADGTVLLAGGDDGSGATNSAETYDVMSGRWTAAAALLDARAGHTLTALADGRIAAIGGAGSGGVLHTVELFDPGTGARSMGPSLLAARRDHGAALLPDGRVLVVGGTDGTNALASTEIVDLESGEVTPGPDLPQPRTGVTASLLLNGKVLIAGGNNGEQELASTLIYNPADGSLAAGTTLQTARSGHTAAVLPHNNSVLIAGGKSGDTELASAELYVYWQNATKPTGSMASGRMGAAAAGTAAEGAAIIAGGHVQSAEAYGFATVKTDKDDYAPGDPVYITGSGWDSGESVTLALDEAPLLHSRRVMTTVADANGNIANSEFAPESHDIGVRFYLTATGQRSGRTARLTFTDSPKVGSVTVGAQTGTLTAGTVGSASYTVTLSRGSGPGSPGAFSAIITVTGLPSGVTAAPLSIALTSGQSSNSGTLTLSTTATAAATAGTPFSLLASRSDNSTDNASATGTLVIGAPADSTPPVITPTVTGTLGSNGWYTSDVNVSWSVTDAQSAVTSSTGCGSTNITADTAGTTLTCSATSAGGTASQSVTIKRDTVAPAVSATPNPAANGNGWNNTDVTVSYACTDATSGVNTGASSLADDLLTASGTASGTCVDNAGHSSTATYDAQMDKTAPVITGERLTAANGNGWNNTDVTVKFTCTDSGGSGVASSPTTETVTVTTEGANQTASSTLACTDAAGNSAAAASVTGISIDKSAPNAPTGSRSPAANAAGWNNSDVTVSFASAGDNGPSGVGSCTASTTISTETTGTNVEGTCADLAGNVSPTTTVVVKLDKTKPVISGSRSPEPNLNGWNNTDVAVSFTCADTGGSGIDQNTVAGATVSAEGAGQSVTSTGICTDVAGNSADAATVSDINIDKTAPTITAGRTPAANTDGWNNTDVIASYSAGDTLSGLPSGAATGSHTFSAEGANQSHTFTVTDLAGNSASATVADVNIDKTAPTVAVTGVTDGGVYTLGAVPAAGCSTTDGLSGVAANATLAVTGGVAPGVGPHTARCSGGADRAGNLRADVTVTYTVQYLQTGMCLGSPGHTILQPINVDGTSVFKQKSTVPAKFRICDANGNSIGTPGVVTAFQQVSAMTGTVTVVNESLDSTTPDTAFRWDPVAQQWIFNMSTRSLSANASYIFRVTLNDGSYIYFQYGLR